MRCILPLSPGLLSCLVFMMLVMSSHADYLNMDTGTIIPHNGTNSTDSAPNNKTTSLRDEVKCYNLPIGAMGFLSHLLNYWSMYWLGYGRRPYAPWMRLSTAKLDLLLSVSQIVSSSTIASFSISRCRNRIPFVMISVWKLIMSLEVGIWGVSASIKARQNQKARGAYRRLDEKENTRPPQIWSKRDWTPYTLIVYLGGAIVGMIGTISLTSQTWSESTMVIITATFITTAGFVVILCILLRTCGAALQDPSRMKFIMLLILGFVLACALYSDWILAAIAKNYVGTPAKENAALYWTYFAAKRLPLLFN